MKYFILFAMLIGVATAALAGPTPIIVDGKCVLFCNE